MRFFFRRSTLPLSVTAGLGVTAGLLGCPPRAPSAGQAPPRAAASPVPVPEQTGSPEPVEIPSRGEAAPAPDPAVFVRLGDALLPLGCKREGAWVGAGACLEPDRWEQVTVYPRLDGEEQVLSAFPSAIPFVASGDKEIGLLLSPTDPEADEIDRPLLGFAVARSPSPVRFTEGASQRIAEDAATWCADSETECQSMANQALPELSRRRWSGEQVEQARELVREVLSPRAKKITVEGGNGVEVNVDGAPQSILDLAIDTAQLPADKVSELNLPSHLHYLIAETPAGLRRLRVRRQYDFGLEESGELVGALDADADGTDELLLEWRYSEGRTWELVRRDGDELLVIGSFTDGA